MVHRLRWILVAFQQVTGETPSPRHRTGYCWMGCSSDIVGLDHLVCSASVSGVWRQMPVPGAMPHCSKSGHSMRKNRGRFRREECGTTTARIHQNTRSFVCSYILRRTPHAHSSTTGRGEYMGSAPSERVRPLGFRLCFVITATSPVSTNNSHHYAISPIHHSPLTVHHPPLTVRHSPFTTHHSPFDTARYYSPGNPLLLVCTRAYLSPLSPPPLDGRNECF